MTFGEVIEKIMPLVKESDSTDLFIISRQNCEWVVDYPADKIQEFYAEVLKKDPYFVSAFGADFSKSNDSFVYNTLLCNRINNEYEYELRINNQSYVNSKDSFALINFFEVNIDAFSPEIKDYFTSIDKPFSALREMCPISLANDRPGWLRSDDLTQYVINHIEHSVKERKENQKTIDNPNEKRMINDYEVIKSILFDNKEYIIGENKNANTEMPYMTCVGVQITDDDFLILEHEITSRDYLTVFNYFAENLSEDVKQLLNERDEHGISAAPLTEEHCMKNGFDKDIFNEIIIIKPSILLPEYRTSNYQINIAIDGNGCRVNSENEAAVFCKNIYSGETLRYQKSDIAGVADIEKLPEWAKVKITLTEAMKDNIIENKEISLKTVENGTLNKNQSTPLEKTEKSLPDGAFAFGGYHFVPYRQYNRSEMSKDKTVKQETFSRMSNDFGLGISKYSWKKEGVDYSHEKFYAASGDSKADIFKCMENGYLYVPHENDLMRYSESPQKENKKESILEKIETNKNTAEQKNNKQNKKKEHEH